MKIAFRSTSKHNLKYTRLRNGLQDCHCVQSALRCGRLLRGDCSIEPREAQPGAEQTQRWSKRLSPNRKESIWAGLEVVQKIVTRLKRVHQSRLRNGQKDRHQPTGDQFTSSQCSGHHFTSCQQRGDTSHQVYGEVNASHQFSGGITTSHQVSREVVASRQFSEEATTSHQS